MFRKRTLLVLAVVTLVIFIVTTNFLLSSLTNESEVSEVHRIEDDIFIELKRLPDYYKTREDSEDDASINFFLKNVNQEGLNIKELDLQQLWKEANSWVSKSQLVNISSSNLGKILYALKNADIRNADVDTRGTQLKLLLTLKGDQHVVFKPKWYEIDKVVEGPVYAGKDRYGSEIIAFYLSILLNKPLTPLSVEREVSFKYEIMPVATKRLLQTSFLHNNQTCIYGKCFYCKKEDPICENHNFLATGAVIFNIKGSLNNYRSPWQRTYKKGKKAPWEEFPNTYCKTVKNKLTKRRLYDLIDTAIFDFLIQNGDRHHYETFDDTVVLLDNGKGLGNPYINHIDILAPLYQCCLLRTEMWKSLLRLKGGRLSEKLMKMPDVNLFLTEAHLKAMEERLLTVFATVEYCRNKKKIQHNVL